MTFGGTFLSIMVAKKIHFQTRYTATSIQSKALVILIKLK